VDIAVVGFLGDEQNKPVLPSKTHRSLPKIPDPGSKPVNPVKPEKPQLPKKGFSLASLPDSVRTNGSGKMYLKS
jgi:hypothetical protein